MKNRHVCMKLVPLTLATAAAAVVCFLLYAGHATAGVGPTPFVTGLVGITEAQTVRLNAVNVGNARAGVELLILDGMSDELSRSTHVLEPGQSASLMLPPTGAGFVGLIRGHVHIRGAGRVVPTLEVVDVATRKTELLITGSTELLPAIHPPDPARR